MNNADMMNLKQKKCPCCTQVKPNDKFDKHKRWCEICEALTTRICPSCEKEKKIHFFNKNENNPICSGCKTPIKKCTSCGSDKSILEFHTSKSRSGGYKSTCKACHLLKYKEYRSPKRILESLDSRVETQSKKDARALYLRDRTHKICRKCNNEKPLDDFVPAHRPGLDTFSSECKNCKSRRMAEYRLERKDGVSGEDVKNELRGITKLCTRCKTEKSANDFRIDKVKRGTKTQCQQCENELTSIYRHANPDKREQWNDRRRRKIANKADGSLTRKVLDKLWEDADKCPYCKDNFSNSPKSLDHLIPIALGGLHAIHNVVICCLKCNTRKSNKLFTEWLREIPMEYRDSVRLLYKQKHGEFPEQLACHLFTVNI